MSKRLRTLGVVLIILFIISDILVIVFSEILVWLFAIMFSFYGICICVLLFTVANNIDKTGSQFRSINSEIKNMMGGNRIEIITEEDIKLIENNYGSLSNLTVKKGVLYFGQYMTLIQNVTNVEIDDNYLKISVFEKILYFSINGGTKKEAQNLYELLNKLIKK